MMRPFVILTVTAAAFVFAGLASSHTGGRRTTTPRALTCGIERWPVKTLADPAEPSIHFAPKSSSVDALAQLPVAVGIGGARGVGAEQTDFKVKAKLVGIKVESDHDFHLVIADPKTGATMIVEFPNQSCTNGAPAAKRTQMENARTAVLTICGLTPHSGYHHLTGTATVTGIAFFDFLHRQTGHAPNGVELHPVLQFTGQCTG
jgi:hypothetical protein